MATYRIYHVETGGRLRLGDTYASASDNEAIAKARALLSAGHAAELWEGGRIVGRFSKVHEFTPGSRAG